MTGQPTPPNISPPMVKISPLLRPNDVRLLWGRLTRDSENHGFFWFDKPSAPDGLKTMSQNKVDDVSLENS